MFYWTIIVVVDNSTVLMFIIPPQLSGKPQAKNTFKARLINPPCHPQIRLKAQKYYKQLGQNKRG